MRLFDGMFNNGFRSTTADFIKAMDSDDTNITGPEDKFKDSDPENIIDFETAKEIKHNLKRGK